MKNLNKPAHGSSTRLLVLISFLLVIGAGCIYEFSVARPKFAAAWEEIKDIDSSANSGEKTSEDIEKLMGQSPFLINEEHHDECVVHTYRWRSGLIVTNHDIHVVYTKLRKGITDANKDLEGRLYYFSAAANTPLDPDGNFPMRKKTIVINLNPPPFFGGGGGSTVSSEDKGNDKKADDADNKEADDTDNKEADDTDDKESEGSADKESEDTAKSDDAAGSGTKNTPKFKTLDQVNREKETRSKAKIDADKKQEASGSKQETSDEQPKQDTDSKKDEASEEGDG